MLEKLGNNSLIVIKDGNIIFKSDKDRLKPIIMCINENKGKMIDSIVIDKIVGLAAAKLFVYARVKEIYALVASKSAFDYLIGKDIKFDTEKIIDEILNDSKTEICPMEKLAQELSEEELFEKLNK
ncbi:DUF1893 domain-containing protein [Candidatus Woesearchaeota archaeon]|nr:DUF1893 domain-containing protein [Candidatus Woesearchaeota archaeon]